MYVYSVYIELYQNQSTFLIFLYLFCKRIGGSVLYVHMVGGGGGFWFDYTVLVPEQHGFSISRMEVPTSQPIIKYFTHSAFCIFFYCCAKTLIAEKMCENWQVNITWQRSNVISLYHMARLYCITWQLYLMSILYLFTKLYSISWLHSMLWLTCLIICALCAGVLYMFYALALVCDHYFVPSLDVIIGRLTGSWYTCTSLFGRYW